MASKLIFRTECRTNNGHGFNSYSTTRHFSAFLAIAQTFFLDTDNLYLSTNLISRILPISEYHSDHIFFTNSCVSTHSIKCNNKPAYYSTEPLQHISSKGWSYLDSHPSNAFSDLFFAISYHNS